MSATTEETVRLPDLTGGSLPLDSFREAAAELRRPFEVKALQWKVQTMWPKGRDKDGRPKQPTGGMIVCYIDRGLVIDRLNTVVPHLWRAEYKDAGHNGLMICRLTIDGITREDVGEAADVKARYSDALKRVAVHFGVGVSLARIPKSRLDTASGNLRAREHWDGKWSLEITQKGLDYLRARYEHWLREVGHDTFGRPLAHGDLGDAQGDAESGGDMAAPDEKVALYLLLTTNTTLRQQRGFLNAAGVANLPQAPTAQEIEQAVSSLSEDQAESLRKLLDTKKEQTDVLD